jgi:hypothetical protein
MQPEPGSISLNSHTIRMAISLLNGDDLSKYGKKDYAFSSLMQLIESIVLHEHIFIPVFFGFVTTYPTFSEERFSRTYDSNLDELAYNSVFGEEIVAEKSGLNKATHLFSFLKKPIILRKLNYSEEHSEQQKEYFDYAPIVASDDPDSYLLSPFSVNNLPFYVETEDQIIQVRKVGLSYKPAPWDYGLTKRLITRARDKYSTFMKGILEEVEDKSELSMQDHRVNKLLNEERFKMEIPIVFAYVFQQYQQKHESIIDTALRIRESTEATAFRKICALFNQAARQNDYELIRIAEEVNLTIDDLNRKFQVKTLDVTLQIPFAIGVGSDLMELMKEINMQRKRHVIFLGNIYRAAKQSKSLEKTFMEYKMNELRRSYP